MGLLCKLGLHKWSRATYTSQALSNVKDWKKKCKRCGKIRRWVSTN